MAYGRGGLGGESRFLPQSVRQSNRLGLQRASEAEVRALSGNPNVDMWMRPQSSGELEADGGSSRSPLFERRRRGIPSPHPKACGGPGRKASELFRFGAG